MLSLSWTDFKPILFYNTLKFLAFSDTINRTTPEGTKGGKGQHTDEFEVDEGDIQKLARICGMLGSNNDGGARKCCS